jgi:hypothetical protein
MQVQSSTPEPSSFVLALQDSCFDFSKSELELEHVLNLPLQLNVVAKEEVVDAYLKATK